MEGGRSMADLTGVNLGKYRITERLGRGGMAEVYKAYHPRLDRYVAIKVLHSFLAGGEGFLERFEREARAVASLRHPNIVLVHDFDMQDDTYFMVMEYVDGITLKDKIEQLSARGEYMPVDQVISLFQQVTSALDYAHNKGLIHRDIKPSNILLDKGQQAYLTDFGIAHIVSDSQFTVTGTLVGTPAYMSPEQGKGDKVSSISDIYSLGIILYQLLTGRVPYEADTPLAVIHKHVNEPLPMPRTLNPSLPEVFERIILKALAKDPGQRFSRATELSQALERASQTQPGTRSGQPAVESLPTVVLSGDDSESGTVKMDGEASPSGEFRTAPIEPDAAPTKVEQPAGEEDMPVTEVMKPEASSPGEKEPTVKPALQPEPDREITPPGKARAPRMQRPSHPAEKEPEPASAPAGEKKNLTPFIAGGVVLLIVVILALSGVFGGSSADCGSADDCYQRAFDYAGTYEAVEYIDAALSQVGRDPGFAEWWCQRGEYLEMVGETREAVDSYEKCMSWAGDDPGFEDLRMRAQESIDRLNQ